MKDIIENILKDLGKDRPVFWSEADFQFSFAWELQKKFPEAKVRLERREDIDSRTVEDEKEPAYIDIWLEMDDKIYPVELKYKTQTLKTKIADETFELKPQSACDVGAHNYIKDIWRIEQLSKKENFGMGYAIMITNDLLYKKEPRNPDNTTFRDFRIFEGRVINAGDVLQWHSASDGTTKSLKEWQENEGPLTIINTYTISWKNYSTIEGDHGEFIYSLVEINK